MLKGSYVALVTPFKNNEIDYNALEKLINFQIENGTDGILLMGTTGETPQIASDERERLLNFCFQRIAGRCKVMIGTGTNNYNTTLALTQKAAKLGADYALVITPYYIKPSQHSLFEYFKKISESVDIPIVIYNVPGRTGVNIAAETTIKLAQECPNIVGIKEASGNILQASTIVKNTSNKFSVMSGEDALNLPLYSVGVKGTISVTANIMPAEVKKLWSLLMNNQVNEAKKLHENLLDINQMLFIETNPVTVKEAMAMMGLIEQEVRLPLVLMLDENRGKLEKCLKKYKLIK